MLEIIALGKVNETASRYQMGECEIIAGTYKGDWALQLRTPNRLPTEEEIEIAMKMFMPPGIRMVAEDVMPGDPEMECAVLLRESH